METNLSVRMVEWRDYDIYLSWKVRNDLYNADNESEQQSNLYRWNV